MDNKFALSLWTIGGVGAVIWATLENRKGRFWWFVAGAAIGGSIGALIDAQANKKEVILSSK